MKRRILLGFFQYLGALLLAAATVFLIRGYESGNLPLMDADYLGAREERAGQSCDAPPPSEEQAPVQSVKQTADGFVSSLRTADESTAPYPGLYTGGCGIVHRPLSGVKLTEGEQLGIRMGFLAVKDKKGKLRSVYDGFLNDVTAACGRYKLTFLRDGEGRPLFRNGEKGTYFRLSEGKMAEAEYDPVNFDKGLFAVEYPSYSALRDENFEVFGEVSGGKSVFGLRKSGGGAVVIPAGYDDVFGVREGYCIAVDAESRLHLFKPDSGGSPGPDSGEPPEPDSGEVKLGGEYFVPEKAERNASALGCFFVDRGLTRARTGEGREIMLRTDGSEFLLPSGFTVGAYSDGALLLKGQNGYGFMLHDGSWISAPEYSDARPFREGLAAVRGKDGLWGMIDLRGNTVVPLLFNNITSSSDGVILADAGKYGYRVLNKTAP